MGGGAAVTCFWYSGQLGGATDPKRPCSGAGQRIRTSIRIRLLPIGGQQHVQVWVSLALLTFLFWHETLNESLILM